MQRVKSFFLSLLFLVAFSVLGIAVGFGVGRVVAILSNEGIFSSWKLFDSHLKFEQIADATSQIVWAKTIDGKLYSWDSYCYSESKCNQWIETSEIPSDIHTGGENQMQKGDSCQSLGFKFFKRPPGYLIECARGWIAGPEFGEVVYYALLSDGSIWAWYYSSSMIVDIVVLIFSLLAVL